MIVLEYDVLHCGSQDDSSSKTLSKRHFEMLEKSLLSEGNRDISQLMKISQRGSEKVIQVQQYVGLVQLCDGFQIEVLPKLYGDGVNVSILDTKRILLAMLRNVFGITPKRSSVANIGAEVHPIVETFVEEFLNEVDTLVKFGLRSNYVDVHSNERYLRGKLLISENLRLNYAHKELFYVQHDDFSKDCSENRLIKSTLLLLKRFCTHSEKLHIDRLLYSFTGVKTSQNYALDFSNCKGIRTSIGYKNALALAKVLLYGRGFSPLSGGSVGYAVAFPMCDIFERYVANLSVSRYPHYDVTVQDTSTYLFETPNKKFNLRPDVVIRQDGKVKCILDTKWKLLTSSGVDIRDMYQMYAYAKRFKCNDIRLIYPKPYTAHPIEETVYLTDDGVSVGVRFIDLKDVTLNHGNFEI